MFLGISQDNWIKIALGLLVLFGSPLAWWWGGRQKQLAELRKIEVEGKNAATNAAAAQQNADTQIMNTVLTGGIGALKSVLESADSIKELLVTVKEQGKELADQAGILSGIQSQHKTDIADLRAEHAEAISALKVAHANERTVANNEINTLRIQVADLSGQVDSLKREIAIKEKALAESADVRRQKDALEAERLVLGHRIEELERANAAYLYLWQAAAENRGDPTTINLAQQAIERAMQSQGAGTSHANLSAQPGAVATLAASLGRSAEPQPGV